MAPATAGPFRFREVASAWGIDFRHHHGGSGKHYMVETVGGGVVLFDYDGDGDLDVLFVDSGALPGYQGEAPKTRLFRNDGNGRFVDVTDRSGIKVKAYGMGGTAGDVDGDGNLDLYISAFGPDQLFHNNGDGTFTDVTAKAGLGDPRWSTAAAFADYDKDGHLDLYVANYVAFDVEHNRYCGNREKGIQGYCTPEAYEGETGILYHNRGDGTFEDVTQKAGLGAAKGAGLGAVWGDIDNDGWPDLYVANDRSPNFLFRNRGNGSFEDVSLTSGTGYSPQGLAEGSMGVDISDYDNDGLLDIVVANFELETDALYKNLGGGTFTDARYPSGIAEPSLLYLKFGIAFADLDQDGDLDLVVANGHVQDHPEAFNGVKPFAQKNQLFENLGNGRFREVTDSGVDAERVHRGLAVGDLDGDGDLDLVIAALNDKAEVWENLGGSASGSSFEVDLQGTKSNGFGIGARLELEAGGKRQIREVKTGTSYLSQSALTAHFGLGKSGDSRKADRLTIRWPSGKVQVWKDLPVDRRFLAVE
ncbi:MAG TPA: CRTAC1 family protein [Thermoanaerobaculia bacterium]|nr:CRTAC1 family protein [Thermoanaerobaculia bacterium]